MPDLSEALVVGVDGGQTSTRCAMATRRGQVLGYGNGGPLIHLAAEGGRARFVESIGAALADTWRSAGLRPRSVMAAGLGLTGVERGSEEATIATGLLAGLLNACRVDVQSDAAIALLGAHEGQPGVVVISGTGTIALGMDRHGRLARAGGWGWLLGDEGSACAIGRSGLIAALAAYDGTGSSTVLKDTFLRHFGLADARDIKRAVYAPDFGARGFASLAPIVAECAAQGDEVARRIVRQAGKALAQEVAAVVQRLDFGGQRVSVALVGGAFGIVGLRSAFVAALRAQGAALSIVKPRLPPVLGAVIMALKLSEASLPAALPALRAWAADHQV